ncbi:MAG: hypothetical protein QM811_03235 [Pirellulales bacterium]
MIWNYARFDFGESFFRNETVINLINRKDAGVDLARRLDNAAVLCHLDSARYPQGGQRTVRPSTSGRRASSSSAMPFPGFLFGILLIVAFRRRLVLRLVSAARHRLGQF